MSTILDEDGCLRLPLYHGTSSYYWPSIKRHGLGGRNIIEEWRLIPLLRHALAILERVEDDHIQHEMHLRLPTLKSIAEQRVTRGGFNWRHGGVYLTLCAWKAVSYGRRGFGSEFLGQVAETMDLLETIRPEAAAELSLEYSEFAAARAGEHHPVLIQIDGLNIARLRDETGVDPQDALGLAEMFVDLGTMDPQVSFELIGAAGRDELNAARVEVTEWKYGIPNTWSSMPLS